MSSTSAPSVQVRRTCGGGAPVDVHFCPQCTKILTLGRQGDYFAFLGVPRKLNLDLDGSRHTYGYNNPSGGVRNLQRNLEPLESWHTGWKGISTALSQKVGLGNAAGAPGWRGRP